MAFEEATAASVLTFVASSDVKQNKCANRKVTINARTEGVDTVEAH